MTSRFKAPFFFLVVLVLLLVTMPAVMAANAVRIVTDLDDSRSQLIMRSSTSSAVDFSVNIDALGLKQESLPEGNYGTLDLADGDNLIPGKSGDIGAPEMPVLTTLIAIPDRAGVTVNATYESFEIIENIDVIPTQPAMPEAGWDAPVEFAKNTMIYERNEFAPSVIAEAGEPLILRDVRVVPITVYPVQYNPVTHQLKVYHNISVDISYEGEVVNPKTTHNRYISEAFLPLYKAYIANWDEYAETFLSSMDVKRGCILMICPDVSGYEWMDEMQKVATWKRQKGYEVVLASSYDVDESGGRPTNTQVKTFIQNAYNTYDMPPDYVYLIGDEDRIIPDYPYSYYASDHNYSMLEGTDYLPDAAVCRVSVDNLTELRTWIAKVMKYEFDPDVDVDPEYWTRAIMVAGCNQTVTCAWTVLWAKERLEERGFTHIDTVFDRGNDPNDNLITNPISAGVGYVNYRGWATASGWLDPSYYSSSLNLCQNVNKPGVMTSIVCGTGDFGDSYSDPCFGETWIRMGSVTAPRGGPSFFGATDHNTHTKWNNPISFGLYGGFLNHDIYHFGMAVIAGKLRQYECYPRENSEIQKYFNTYNMLGDPELEMRLMAPRIISVTHPADVQLGENLMEIHVDNEGHPVADAYATLIMGEGDSEVFFAVSKTDQFGYAALEVPNDTVGTLTLTVSGRDLKPYQSDVTLARADQTVGLEYFTIDDSQSGNGDGLAGPGETVKIFAGLKNYGQGMTAANTVAEINLLDEDKGILHNGMIQAGDLGPNQSYESAFPFILTVKPDVVNTDQITVRLAVTADGVSEPWTSYFNIDIAAPQFLVSDVQISDNGRLDPGDNADVVIELENVGQVDVLGLTGKLVSNDGFVVATASTADFGDIAVDESGSNTSMPFNLTVHENAFEGRNAQFTLMLTSADGAEYSIPINLEIGSLTATDPSGPDRYGYYMYDNTDNGYTEQPTYDWLEVRTMGINKYMGDDTNTLVDLPFDFVYYGESHDRITICSNGWICMDSTQWIGFRNFPLPDPSNAKGMIAGFWDDLGPSGSNNVYVYHDTDDNRFIIEWYNVVARWSSSVHETFQIVLYDPAHHPSISGDGMIEFIYNSITNNHSGSGENYAAIGWEDYSETDGFSISFSNMMSPGCATLTSGRVYRITTNNGFGGVKGAITVENSTSHDVKVDFSSGQWGMAGDDGVYSIKDIPPGMVNLTFSKHGWFPQTLNDVTIPTDDYAVDQNATLAQCPIPSGVDATDNLGDHVRVSWTAVSHADIAGYNVYRSDWANGIYTKLNDTPVSGTYFDDNTTSDGVRYWYGVEAVYEGAEYSAQSLASEPVAGSNEEIVDVDDPLSLPTEFSLSQNYPNPFNAHTTISFGLPNDGNVELDVFNLLGQKVKVLYSGYHPAGFASFVWDGTDGSGQTVASGLYFYRLATDTEKVTKRMMLLK